MLLLLLGVTALAVITVIAVPLFSVDSPDSAPPVIKPSPTSGDPPPRSTPSASTEPTITGSPGSSSPAASRTPPIVGNGAGSPSLRRFKEYCLGETRSLTRAVVRYPGQVRLRVDDAKRFRAVISRADQPMGRQPEGTVRQKIAVGCTVEARLVVSDADLSVSPKDWYGQQFYGTGERSWTWVVTAQQRGTSEASLQLRPVVNLSSGEQQTRVEMGTEEYPVVFRASRTPADAISDAWTTVIAAATGIGTLIGTYFAVRKFRRRDQEPEAAGEEAEPVEALERD